MKRLVAILIFLPTVAGCGSEQEPRSLSSGLYAVSNINVLSDGCQIDPTDLEPVLVEVNGDTASLGDFLSVSIDGTALSGEAQGTADLRPDLDCVLGVEESAVGTITGKDEFDLSLVVEIFVVSGTECGTLPPAFPCSTSFSFHAEK